MEKILLKAGVAIFVMATASCVSQKKFDFSNAYKFDHIDYHEVASDDTNVMTDEKQVEYKNPKTGGTLNKLAPKTLTLPEEHGEHGVSIEHIDLTSNTKSIQSAYKSLTKAERKDVRKALKQTIRDIRTEKIDKSELMTSLEDVEPAQDEKKKRIAKYLLIGGGALVILAIIIGSVPVLTTIGIVAVVVGAVLMILSLNK
jgi:hypothetical protein